MRCREEIYMQARVHDRQMRLYAECLELLSFERKEISWKLISKNLFKADGQEASLRFQFGAEVTKLPIRVKDPTRPARTLRRRHGESLWWNKNMPASWPWPQVSNIALCEDMDLPQLPEKGSGVEQLGGRDAVFRKRGCEVVQGRGLEWRKTNWNEKRDKQSREKNATEPWWPILPLPTRRFGHHRPATGPPSPCGRPVISWFFSIKNLLQPVHREEQHPVTLFRSGGSVQGNLLTARHGIKSWKQGKELKPKSSCRCKRHYT